MKHVVVKVFKVLLKVAKVKCGAHVCEACRGTCLNLWLGQGYVTPTICVCGLTKRCYADYLCDLPNEYNSYEPISGTNKSFTFNHPLIWVKL